MSIEFSLKRIDPVRQSAFHGKTLSKRGGKRTGDKVGEGCFSLYPRKGVHQDCHKAEHYWRLHLRHFW